MSNDAKYDCLTEEELLKGFKETAAAINNLGSYRTYLGTPGALPRNEEARNQLLDSLGKMEEKLEAELRDMLAALARKK
jgi:hypothetical protein